MELGIWTTKQLRDEGFNKVALEHQVRMGALVRLRRGWHAAPWADATAARVVRLGAQLGCISGCAAHGVWTPRSGIHAVYGHGATPPRRVPGIEFHALYGRQPTTALCPLIECLEHVVHYHDAETALICLESAANRGLIRVSTARTIIAGAPVTSAKTLSLFHPAAESGSETRVRLFLAGKQVKVRPQAIIAGMRIDILAGNSLIFECDSERYHSGDVDRDRRRDMSSARLGYDVVRLSWQQIWLTWSETKAYITEVIRTRRHLRMPRPLRPAS